MPGQTVLRGPWRGEFIAKAIVKVVNAIKLGSGHIAPAHAQASQSSFDLSAHVTDLGAHARWTDITRLDNMVAIVGLALGDLPAS